MLSWSSGHAPAWFAFFLKCDLKMRPPLRFVNFFPTAEIVMQNVPCLSADSPVFANCPAFVMISICCTDKTVNSITAVVQCYHN